MFKRILVLNTPVSGMNNFLFAALRDEGWELEICDIPLPKTATLLAYISTFNFNLRRWKDAKNARLGSYLKDPDIFWQRSRICEKLLKKKWRSGDLILQIAGLFAPGPDMEKIPGPYAVFLSFTTKLAAREYPPWAPFSSERLRKAWYECEEYLYQNAGLTITTNAHARKNLIEDYQVEAEKISVIGYGVNLENPLPLEGPRHYKQILYIGYDFVRKGGPTILEAFAILRESEPDANLIIIGPPPPETIPPGVQWLGPVQDREVIASYLRKSALFVMPSICEPFGLVFLEAMANKLPCVGSREDAMPEIIAEGETGYLINVGDSADLAGKMLMIISDEELRDRLGEAAARRVDEVFTWKLVGSRVTKAIKEMEIKTKSA